MNIYLSNFGISGCAVFGLKELKEAAENRGMNIRETSVLHAMRQESDLFSIAAGPIHDLRIRDIAEANEMEEFLWKEESLVCQRCLVRDGEVLLLAGSDEIGTMYALLEMARKIRLYGDAALIQAENIHEEADNRVRCVDRYLLGHLDNDWFLSDAFWDDYMKKLAYDRYNRLCLIVGFDTAYMAPPYPFFLPPMESFPHVKPLKFTEEDAKANLLRLKKIGEMCHAHGMKFVFATWQQRPWTTEQERLVENLPEDEHELSEYCYEGVKALLMAAPEIDVVQFRVNLESGVGGEVSAEEFWNHCIDAVAEAGRANGKKFIMDLRAKGLTEEMVAHAFEQDLEVEVPTKYWCEHAALPYHITVMRSEELAQMDNFNHSRRYSYADMLKKPKRYSLIFRLWNYGSTNLFLWGDADYARRFSESCRIGGSAGFEINAPLSLKYGHELTHTKRWSVFTDETMRYGNWEEDRFWNWYTVFGRLGYNAKTDPEVWESEYVQHFGAGAGAAQNTLEIASRIVPLITTVHMPIHPSLRYWTELNTGWALFEENNLEESECFHFYTHLTYGSTEPSDHQLFYGIDEYAKDCCEGVPKGKYTPLQYAAWLADLSEAVLEGLEKFKLEAVGDEAEKRAFITDLQMVADLGLYHAKKIMAALHLAYSRFRDEAAELKKAYAYMKDAAYCWGRLSERGDQYYYEDLNFSAAGSETRRRNWRFLEKEVQADLKTLEAAVNDRVEEAPEFEKISPEEIYAEFPGTTHAGETLCICAQANLRAGERLTLYYRHMNQMDGMFCETEFVKNENGYTAEVPAEYITNQFDLMVFIARYSKEDGCRIYPGIYSSDYSYPYHVIEVKGEVH